MIKKKRKKLKIVFYCHFDLKKNEKNHKSLFFVYKNSFFCLGFLLFTKFSEIVQGFLFFTKCIAKIDLGWDVFRWFPLNNKQQLNNVRAQGLGFGAVD